ncbi:roadblock/LC7 domain-containing protein (plasmid) [Streptomyces sp. SDT5-1]|uniref:roadblock/LC7 domain-containing protein n=1 Tax=Streptomyces sp. SDT5-1 TaxID=3406418 RepID=UPI003FD69277
MQIQTSTAPHANSRGEDLERFIGSLDGVRCAVLLSGDGLLHSRTHGLTQDEGERLAAMASGIWAITGQYDQGSRGGGVRQVLLELDRHLCLISQVGENMRLMVETTSPHVDVATIAGQMALMAHSGDPRLAVAERTPTDEPGT